MASSLLFSLVIFTLAIAMVTASEPDILTDFIAPANNYATPIDGNFFTYTGMRSVINCTDPKNFTVTKASLKEFPALDGQSVSYAVLEFPAGSVNPPHTHPRSGELAFVVDGSLEVGFVDSTNRLYTQSLQLGDMFVFPIGLVHFQYNSDGSDSATAVSAFGSAIAGTVSLPSTLFATGVDDNVLAKSFRTDLATIQKIKAGLGIKA